MKRMTWLVPALYIVFLMLPIYWLLCMSFKNTNEILGHFTPWPQNFTLENYRNMFDNSDITHALWVTVQVTIGATVLPILVASCAAYARTMPSPVLARTAPGTAVTAATCAAEHFVSAGVHAIALRQSRSPFTRLSAQTPPINTDPAADATAQRGTRPGDGAARKNAATCTSRTSSITSPGFKADP